MFDDAPQLRAVRVPVHRRGAQRVEQKLPPPVEKFRARVHLDGEHVAQRELLARHQPLANLTRARADLVAAVTQLREHLAAHDARVGGPDAPVWRIDDTRVLGAIEPSFPAARAVGPRRRERTVEAHTPRNRGVHRPADAPGVIGDDEILTGDARAVGLVKGLFDRSGRFERRHRGCQPFR